jgi:hypothetical protein
VKLTILIVLLIVFGALMVIPKKTSSVSEDDDPSIRVVELMTELEELNQLVKELDKAPAPPKTRYGFSLTGSVDEALVMAAFPNEPRMVAIFRCESGLKQFNDDGTPIRSHTNDWGIAQINEKTWDSTAQSLGLDYKYSLEDNLKMAQHVYRVQGITAWVCLGLI